MNLQVGVKVFLKNEEGRILLLKRSEEKYGKTSGSWDIVGGRIDPGTTLIENLKREVQEETQLTITSIPKLIGAQDIIPNDERHIVRLTYVALTTGEPVLDLSENTEYKWVTLEELSKELDIDTYAAALLQEGLLKVNSWD
ncbi:MAG: MutT related protein [Parcubacteria group bacterium]|nr:MutT related protein [Parcubacteria group bacterium]